MKSHYISPIILPFSLYSCTCIFLKNCPYIKPYIFAWGYFKPWIWHRLLTPIWHWPSPRDCTLASSQSVTTCTAVHCIKWIIDEKGVLIWVHVCTCSALIWRWLLQASGVPTIPLRSPGFYKAPSPWVSCELTLIWTGPFLVRVQCTCVTDCWHFRHCYNCIVEKQTSCAKKYD